MVDRFIRIARDWCNQNKHVNGTKIKSFIDNYNNIVYVSTGVSPNGIQKNKNLN
ncbi:MAG: hypothetical protein Ta2E_00060 [Mycoplasmoidaceae bacterium]|nr:MAG: hypothetical protein Ta2E_00060 [Mycoplasmoidaceae bacterium]